MSFPVNPSVGATHETASGVVYVYTPKKVWKIYSSPAGQGSKFTVGSTAPTNPALTDQWYDTTNDALKIWINNGADYLWESVNGAYDGLGSGPADHVLPISWGYSSEGFSFELFGNDPRYSWRDSTPVRVVTGYNGDNTLDVTNSDSLKVGATYIIYTAAGLRLEVDVASIINKNRVRLRNNLNTNILETDNAYIARTSFQMSEGVAIVRNNDGFYTKAINTLRDRENGRLVLRRSGGGVGTFTVRYRKVGGVAWTTAGLLRSEASGAETRDEFYEILTGGTLEFHIRFSADSNQTDTLYHGAVFTAPEIIELGRVEKPYNVSPADQAVNQSATPTLTLSEYFSLYDIEQGGAEFQIAEDENFTNIAVSSSTSFLAAWVNENGFTFPITDMEYFPDGDLAIGTTTAADSFYIRQASNDAFVKRATGYPTNALAVTTGLVYAVSNTGGVRYSSNKGTTWLVSNMANSYTGNLYAVGAAGQNAFVAGQNGEIQRTVNGGAIFNRVTPDNAYTGTWYGAYLAPNGRGIVVGSGGEIQTTGNFGAAFTKRQPQGNYTGTFRATYFREIDGVGFAVGDNGEIQRTEDYGSSWRRITPDDNYTGTFYAVHMFEDFVVLVGSNGQIQTSVDAGQSFTKRIAAASFTSNFRAVAVRANNAIIGGDNSLQRTASITGIVGDSYTVPAGTDLLKTGKVYWWHGRYQDRVGFWSSWSEATAFATSAEFDYVRQPSNLAPAQGAVGVSLTPTLQASAFEFVGAADTHVASQWEIATTATTFNQPVYKSNDVTDLLTHTVPIANRLTDRTSYVWRVRYKGASGRYSPWSVPSTFETQLRPNTPAITSPTVNQTGVSLTPTLRTNGFSISGATAAHQATQWQVATDLNFTDMIVDTGESSNLTEYTMAAGRLVSNKEYFVRARHRGVNTELSLWSPATKFTTVTVSVRAPTAVEVTQVTSVSLSVLTGEFRLNGTGASDTLLHTDWELRSAANGGGTLIQTARTTGGRLNYTFTGLNPNTPYFVRARQTGTTYGNSDWSPDAITATAAVAIKKATLTVGTIGATSVVLNVDTFGIDGTGTTDVHRATKWEVRTAANGGGTRVYYEEATAAAAKAQTTATGLSVNTTYYARARFEGTTYGDGPWSDEKTFKTPVAAGQQQYTTPGAISFTVPEGVTSISAVGIGPGANGLSSSGGGAGALTYRNNIPVTPGQVITGNVGSAGQNTTFGSFITAAAASGSNGGAASTTSGVTSFAGGNGGAYYSGYGGGGGAAARYSKAGGSGAGYSSSSESYYVPGTTSKYWEMTSDVYSHQIARNEAPTPRVTSGSTSTSQATGSQYTYQAWVYSGQDYLNRASYEIRNQTYTLREQTSAGYYDTRTSYYSTSPSGTTGSGRGGNAGGDGEGANLVGTDAAGNYGAGGGATSRAAQSGALRIVWGGNAVFPS